jgi:hypothetical protein
MCSCAEFILYAVNMTFLVAGLAITGLAVRRMSVGDFHLAISQPHGEC